MLDAYPILRNTRINSTGAGAPGTRFKGGEGIWIQFWPEGARDTVSGYDVDNLVVSPAGDAMRLMVPNQPARILLQVPGGGSELTGPAFTPDGSRLYFSSQRGPSGLLGLSSLGRTYELTVPETFR
ncbi:hypothetical protein ISO4_01017 [Alcanivorax venustensis ISO4]|uniref:Translocation protein TolB n=1 Tax=Alloalcanivorax venustensis ISO4 TaxID=1177184 RepID=A0ABS0AE41_9GAMM|nr:hypothetical protein [Alloalcanivorax venustensis]MBF5052415.1 hypothetical protein [Alloalcanivorax venustensis ISO4]